MVKTIKIRQKTKVEVLDEIKSLLSQPFNKSLDKKYVVVADERFDITAGINDHDCLCVEFEIHPPYLFTLDEASEAVSKFFIVKVGEDRKNEVIHFHTEKYYDFLTKKAIKYSK